MRSTTRSLFLITCAIIRRIPNWPKAFRSVIAYRLAAISAPGKAIISIKEGCRLDIDLGDWLQRLYAMGETDLPSRRALTRYLPEGGTFIDVGANVGLYACSMAKRVGPKGHCFAFEPLPRNFGSLLRNVKLNGLHNVDTQRIALSSESGSMILYGPPGDRNDNLGAVGSRLADDYVEVGRAPCQPLDSVDVGARVDAIKIDVEGNELEVLRGARRLLATCRPTLLIEVNNPSIYRGVVAFAAELNFALLEVDRRGRPTNHDAGRPVRVNDLLLVPAERHK